MRVRYPLRLAFYINGGCRKRNSGLPVGDLLETECADRREMARHAQRLADKHGAIIFVSDAKSHIHVAWSSPRAWERA